MLSNAQNPDPDTTHDITNRRKARSWNDALMLLPADAEPSIEGTVFDPFSAFIHFKIISTFSQLEKEKKGEKQMHKDFKFVY